MKNIPEKKERLKKIRDEEKFILWFDSVPESKELTIEIRGILLEGIISTINKILKHFDSKNPSKSSISKLLGRAIFKLQCEGIRYEGQHCLFTVLEKIMNETIEGFFNKRLNVKSKQFLDLEDCDPF